MGVLALAAAAAWSASASAALVHRWSFNDETANDSVGSAHGTLQNGATISGGKVVLGGIAQHVSLPGSTIAINSYNSATFEIWLTSSPANTNYTMAAVLGRTYDAGLGEPSWAGYQYIMIQPTRGGGPAASRAAITAARFEAESGVNGLGQINDGVPHHLAVTVNAASIAYYIDGALIGAATVGANTLSSLSNNLAYLGRSVYQQDPYFRGSVDEFRIYNSVLGASTIASHARLGPNVVPESSTIVLATLGLLGATFARRHRRRLFRAACVKSFTAMACAALLWNVADVAHADWLIKSYSLNYSISNYAAADALVAGVGLAPGFPVSSQYALAHVQDNDIQNTSLGLGQQIVGLPGAPTDSDNFVFVGSGTLNVNATGSYSFRTATDDGSRLRISINGGSPQQIISDDVLSAMHLADSLPVSLSAGDKVDFDWMIFERSGGAEGLLLYWNGIAPRMKLVGDSSLGLSLDGGSYTGNVYLAQSFPIGSFADAEAVKATPGSERGSALRNLFNVQDGGELPPGIAPGDEHYFTQGTGLLVVRPGQAGLYSFGSFSDDGARLQIDFNVDGDFDDDGELLIDDDALGSHQSVSNSVMLSPGRFPIQYSYFNNIFGGSGAVTAVNWGLPYGHVMLGDEVYGLDVIQVPEPSLSVLAAATIAGLIGRFSRRRRMFG